MERKVIAIIPARGGSKGIPHKNRLILANKPLIAHTIRAAQQSKYINRIVVSTDDSVVEEIALSYGSEVIWRPAEISNDEASSESALLHSLDFLQRTEDFVPDLLVFLQCTSPFTSAEDIDNAIELLLREGADSALTVTPFHYYLWRLTEDDEAIGINHDKRMRLPRQESEDQYLETGAVYVMDVKGFMEAKHRFFGKTVLSLMPKEHCLEIDDAMDYRIAESMLQGSSQATIEVNLAIKMRQIKLLATDVDGVLTDSGMYYSEGGDELKKFNTRDGMGFQLLKEAGISTAIITSENTQITAKRANKLMIDFIRQDIKDKLQCISEMASELDIDLDEVCYIGDDINDLPVLMNVGLACCPADALFENKKVCHYITELKSGQGCVREVINLILEHR